MNFHKSFLRDIVILAGMIGLLSLVKMQMSLAYSHDFSDSYTCVAKFESPGQDRGAETDRYARDHFDMIPCHVIFDIHEYHVCANVPAFYYYKNPDYYTRTQTYFNILSYVNYSKFRQCMTDAYILYINKLDKEHMTSFLLIS